MGLLDSVLDAVVNNVGQHNGGSVTAGAGGLGALGGLGGLVGLVASNPQILQSVVSLLGNDGPVGGLSGLVQRFQQAGLGDVMASWTGTGANQAISGDQISQVLGSGALQQVAAQLGMGEGDAAHQLSQVLPSLVDHLTPQGQVPQEGLGNSGDLFGMLGGLLQK